MNTLENSAPVWLDFIESECAEGIRNYIEEQKMNAYATKTLRWYLKSIYYRYVRSCWYNIREISPSFQEYATHFFWENIHDPELVPAEYIEEMKELVGKKPKVINDGLRNGHTYWKKKI